MVSHKIHIFMLCFFCDPYISSSRFKLIISNLLHVNYKELVMIIKEVKLMAGQTSGRGKGEQRAGEEFIRPLQIKD